MAGDFNVKIDNIDKLKKAFESYPQISEPILQKAVRGSSAILARYTLKDNPIPFRTGNLLQSFRDDYGRLYSRWYPTANYALVVHEGFGGRRSNRYMPKILDKAMPQLNQLFTDALDKITEQLAV